ncbi:MAG: oxygenase MpaB family protein [Actinomycetota bacterium]
MRLDPEEDHKRIVYLDVCYEFPWDTTRALELALFRTFAVPSIGKLLDSTGEFYRSAQKRYDDTDLIISTMLEDGYDSPSGRAALRRMNQIHRRFSISNEDYLYVLSTFVLEPVRWNECFGWRRMVDHERLANLHCWRAIGRRMNITDIPQTYAALDSFNRDYEREHFSSTDATQRVGVATRNMFLDWFPHLVRGLATHSIYALLDDRLLRAFGFPQPSPVARRVIVGSLRARARLLRLLPQRRRPRLRTQIKHRTYPSGYRLDSLGPEG